MAKLICVAVLFLCGTAADGYAQRGPDSSPTHFLRGPGFFALQVVDLGAVESWYRRVFDLEPLTVVDADDGRYAIRILGGGGFFVELIRERDVAPGTRRQQGLFKAGVFVEDIGGFREALLARGVDVDPQVFVDEALRMRSFVFRDPEGNRIQALEPCAGACPAPLSGAPR